MYQSELDRPAQQELADPDESQQSADPGLFPAISASRAKLNYGRPLLASVTWLSWIRSGVTFTSADVCTGTRIACISAARRRWAVCPSSVMAAHMPRRANAAQPTIPSGIQRINSMIMSPRSFPTEKIDPAGHGCKHLIRCFL
jgi:hypothetical protein